MIYRKASLGNPHFRSSSEREGPRIESDGLMLGAKELQIPLIAFGTTDPTYLNLPVQDYTSWYQQTLHSPEVHRSRIYNAVVHPPYGIITIDDCVLTETLGYIPFHHPGYATGDVEVTIPWGGIGGSFKQALHVMGGNFTNHYHWLLDILPKLLVEPLSQSAFDGTILVSPPASPAQQDLLMRLLLTNRPVMSLAGNHAIHVESLLFVPNLVGFGYNPNPSLGLIFDQLRRLLGVDEVSTRRIYVARSDSQNRVLVNEAEVIALVERFGFEVVHLTNLNLETQARLFASASHIIAPHGGGLANLVFCNPGISICELHMSGYLNWCFRRLSGIRSANYGCVVGFPEPSSDKWVHNLRWSAPLAELEAILNDRRFMEFRAESRTTP